MRESIHRSKQKEAYQQAAQPEAVSSGIPNSALEAVMAGKARASSEMMGHRQDLAPSLAAKMSKAFGMDLSQMQLYRTNAMEGTETKGMASGNKVVLSKDIDLNTMAGQAVLGHEISHVRAQSQGIGMGHSGLYDNASLEHQADTEGMMAARGQSILGESTGMETSLGMGSIGGLTPLGAGMSASAGAPMQAKDKKKGKKGKPAAIPVMSDEAYEKSADTGELSDEENEEIGNLVDERQERLNETNAIINGVQWKNGPNDLSYQKWCDDKETNFMTTQWGIEYLENHGDLENKGKWGKILEDANNREMELVRQDKAQKKAGNPVDKREHYDPVLGKAQKNRLIPEFVNTNGADDELIENIASTDPTKLAKARKRIKELHYQELLRKEQKWGKLLQQMDIDDVVERGGAGGLAGDISVGLQMGDVNRGDDGYEFGDERDDRYKQLDEYFSLFSQYMMWAKMNTKGQMDKNSVEKSKAEYKEKFMNSAKVNGKDVIQNGPSLNEEQLKAYKWSKRK